MILELSLLSASGILMILLLLQKRFERAVGARNPMEDVKAKTDPMLRNLHYTTGKLFSYFTIHNAVLLANYIFVFIVRMFMNSSRKVHNVSANIVAKASKKTEDLSRGGAASFYLKKIKEGKGSGNGAEIK